MNPGSDCLAEPSHRAYDRWASAAGCQISTSMSYWNWNQPPKQLFNLFTSGKKQRDDSALQMPEILCVIYIR